MSIDIHSTTTLDLVVRALQTTLDRDLGEVTEDTALFTTLGLDSTGVLDLLMNLEDELGISLEAEELEMSDFATVGSLVRYVEPLRAE
ncbi:acyl carrier protein [Granulicoccus sp. GXG6511]|uniref:acyl carrier protein n=1 Tax=Granulicoccus sp. GXG6511 TaxID=3381351 RepID=UPI003D7C52CA